MGSVTPWGVVIGGLILFIIGGVASGAIASPSGVVIGWLIFFIICGVGSGAIASRKNRSVAGFFLLGFLFPIVGLIVALIVSPGQPEAPAGLRAVNCPRCNARQNIDPKIGTYECWQCKTNQPV